MVLDKPLREVLNTTSRHLKGLKDLGIETLKDLLLYFPRDYSDQREMTTISEMRTDQVNVVKGRLRNIFARTTRLGKFLMKADFFDESGSVEVVWFNQPYLRQLLHENVEVILSGKLKFDRGHVSFPSPQLELVKPDLIHTARIVPVYREHEVDAQFMSKRTDIKKTRVSSKWLREKIKPLLGYAREFEEYMPDSILSRQKLMSYSDAVAQMHFPSEENKLAEARRRLAFDELFMIQLFALYRRVKWQRAASADKKIKIDADLHGSFLSQLPFQLTAAQNRVINELFSDFSEMQPMLRLLQGDVGSGKTVVAAAVLLQVIKSGYQSLIMAPTEILALQHFQTLQPLLANFQVQVEYLSGSTPQKARSLVFQGMANGQIDLVIGTHALIQDQIQFRSLGMAIIDEQHRFGVRQRSRLKDYGTPHMLAMTATPIPRTLAMTLYGDLDLSVLDEMPPGRKEVVTRIVPDAKRIAAYRWVEEQIRKKRQAFIICPLIEESEVLEVKAAIAEFERLSKDVFPGLRLGLLHGRMYADEKDSVMKRFKQGDLHILVSTAVVEVGIDVPNATIIIIEGAERFGLSQLHQFRGRVGRGKNQSYCFLFPSKDDAASNQRLKALVSCYDGFKLAEIDLQLRGPGEVYGVKQSGIPDLKIASFLDTELIKLARHEALLVLQQDPEFVKNAGLKKKLHELMERMGKE